MIRFLIKGILKDRNRSLLPVIVISIGVALTVVMVSWIKGVIGESVELNASFTTGHLKVVARAYAADETQMPLDLSLTSADSLRKQLQEHYPAVEWVERTRFGALIDFPDSAGETRAQGPVSGWAIDLSDPSEIKRFNLEKSIVEGKLPSASGEALITSDFAERYKVRTGDVFTLFGTTMDGGMAFMNFRTAGLVRFGSSPLDRGAVFISITDAGQAFAMNDATGEILGFFNSGRYDNDIATDIMNSFNKTSSPGDYNPVMERMTDQGGMADYIGIADMMAFIMISVFVLAMSVVLWNAGLLGGLRRYTEFGIRLAMGEEKRHIYKTLIAEALIIGMIGSVTGTAIGLGAAYYLQEVGISLQGMMQNSSILMPSVARASVTSLAWYIGFIPGVISMVLGNALSGMVIYKRKTASLFKELEV